MLTKVFILLIHISCAAEVHFIHSHGIASKGTLCPKNINFMMVDDIIVYHYNSSSGQSKPMPEWMNHPEGIAFWTQLKGQLEMNRYVLDTGVQLASDRFNRSDDHIYEGYSHCGFNTDGKLDTFIRHSYNGKDFVYFDVPTKSWIAAIPEAVFYVKLRADSIEDLNRMTSHYEQGCLIVLNKLLNFTAKIRTAKVPSVRVLERQLSSDSKVEVTCHVTGFYPREVQVKWLDTEGLPLVEGVSSGEVLPNGDGSYQQRKIMKLSKGDLQSHRYSCVVLHSSVEGNITVTWVPKTRFIIWRISLISVSFCLLIMTVSFLAIRMLFRRG